MNLDEVSANPGYLDILNYIAVFLSITGCVWVLWFCLSTRPKSVALKLVMAISLSDLLYSMSNMFSAFHYEEANNQTFCQIEGFIRECGINLSIYFVTITAILCYKDSKYGSSFRQDKFLRLSVLIGIVIALGMSLPPLFLQDVRYQQVEQLFCWAVYTPDQTDLDKRFLVVFIFQGVPLSLGFTVTLVGYVRAIRNYEKELNAAFDLGTIDVKKLLWYPASLFIIMLPSLADNLVEIYHPSGNAVLKGAHLLLTHSSGFVNALVYGLQMRNAVNRNYVRRSSHVQHSEQQSGSGAGLTNSITQELFVASVMDFHSVE